MEGGLFDGTRLGTAPAGSPGNSADADGPDERADGPFDGPRRCFFLVAASARGSARGTLSSEEELTECRAFRDPLMVSPRQRELVCLTPVHASCPRFLRATVVEQDEIEPEAEEPRPARGSSAPQIASRLFDIALAIALTVIIVVAVAAATSPLWGGTLAGSKSTPGPLSTSSAPVATSTPTAAPTATATPTPTATPRPSPTATPVTSPSWPPGATASRMNLLTPCPDRQNCYLYSVKLGDRLRGIAEFFGVELDAILALNPQITNPDVIEAGATIRIPPPTK